MDFITLLLLFVIVLFFAISLLLILLTKKKVLNSSVKIKNLEELNAQIGFHSIENIFEIYKHYDNKGSFNKIDPAFIMSANIKENLLYFKEYSEKLRDNRAKLADYEDLVNKIQETNYKTDYKSLKIPGFIFSFFERRMFSRKTLKPVVDCLFVVHMSYSSPKGKVNLSKFGKFNFDDMFVSLESVSRTFLDRTTYSRLAAVERGELSDSMRYDILNRDNFTCVICGASSRQGVRLHVDHIIPVSKGGKSVPSNLRTLCERCNIGKSNKTETAFSANEVKEDNDQICPQCGAHLVRKSGKYGDFFGCSSFPRCKFRKSIKG